MWPFKDKAYIDVEVVVINYIHTTQVLKVYDNGHGAYIKSYLSKNPRYLTRDGLFQDKTYECNGDAVSWKIHKGDKSKLKFRED